MRTVQFIGVPAQPIPGAVDAVVVALKSRTAPSVEAVPRSLAALEWLTAAETRQFFFKYCQTFDSTDAGNIAPVADALLDALNTGFTVFCPALPENGRTVYLGHLFVGDALLSDSGMRDHPLTPMRDPSLRRVLSRRTKHKIGPVPLMAVSRGVAAVRAELARLRRVGCSHAIPDAVRDEDFRRAGLLGIAQRVDSLPPAPGAAVVISGSCSAATLAQVAAMRRTNPVFDLDVLALAAGAPVVARSFD